MLSITYRPVGSETAGEALTLQRAAFLAEARTYGSVDIPPLTETLDDLLRELETNTTIGAFLGERLVGAARLTLDGSTGWISRVAVAPDLQGKGIGSGLLEAVEAIAPPEVTRFKLGAGGRSAGNIAMYERRGYREISRTFDSVGIELIIMARER
ncbi:MAG: GNAT family N-acetyltransferase [Acidimicrobiales bacterium]